MCTIDKNENILEKKINKTFHFFLELNEMRNRRRIAISKSAAINHKQTKITILVIIF